MKVAVIGWTERVSTKAGADYGSLALAQPMPSPLYPGVDFFADEAEWAAQGVYEVLVPMDDPVWAYIAAGNSHGEPFVLTWPDA